MTNEEKRRLFVDIDGTLAVFTPIEQIEVLYEKGYFQNLKPINSVLDAMKMIHFSEPNIEIYVLSSFLKDSAYALNEKNLWIDQYFPQISKSHRIFIPCGTDKKDFVPNFSSSKDFLLDDYTANLKTWPNPQNAIKILNGINSTNGTWKQSCLSYDKPPLELAKDILEVLNGKFKRDEKPTQKTFFKNSK